jgi:alpha-L-arabinofuranosidase
VNDIDTSAVLGDELLHIFLVNRNLEEPARVQVHFPGGELDALDSAEILSGSNPNDCNTYEHPVRITSQPFSDLHIQDGMAVFEMPPLSIVASSFTTS